MRLKGIAIAVLIGVVVMNGVESHRGRAVSKPHNALREFYISSNAKCVFVIYDSPDVEPSYGAVFNLSDFEVGIHAWGMRLTNEEAEVLFAKVRWPETNGEPICPFRGGLVHYTIRRAREASSWNMLHGRFAVDRIDHTQAYSLDGVSSNQAESFFSRLRRGERGHFHHISGPYLAAYARESAWREDYRRVSNGDQTQRAAALAMASGPSVDFCGYWQRHQR
jgi:hypothetical protein